LEFSTFIAQVPGNKIMLSQEFLKIGITLTAQIFQQQHELPNRK